MTIEFDAAPTSITEYHPDENLTVHKIDAGYNLKFTFVRGYGNSTKDRHVFGH